MQVVGQYKKYLFFMAINNRINKFLKFRKPWKNNEDGGYERQSYSDGKLEIVGFHTAGFVSVFRLKYSKIWLNWTYS